MLPSPPFNTTSSRRSPDPGGVAEHPLAASQRLAVGLLRAYKILISPLFTGCCRFEPSCSDYMAEAVQQHGVMKGMWLGARRLATCVPFGRHGFDPVPPRSIR